jgi:hypothetical protein
MDNTKQHENHEHPGTSAHISQETEPANKLLRLLQFLNKLSFSAGNVGRFWWIMLSIALCVMGLSWSWNTLRTAYIARESTHHWVTAECKISVSHAKELYREMRAGRHAQTIYRLYYYKPEVLCEYTIEEIGSSFDAPLTYRLPIKKEFHGRQTGKSQVGKWLLENYPKGQSIEIYYNPDNPQQAVLTTGNIFWGQILFYGSLGIGITVLGLAMLIAFFSPKCSK